jgi:hypothetical protein
VAVLVPRSNRFYGRTEMIGKGRGKGIGGSSSGRGVDLGGAADWKEEAGGG